MLIISIANNTFSINFIFNQNMQWRLVMRNGVGHTKRQSTVRMMPLFINSFFNVFL